MLTTLAEHRKQGHAERCVLALCRRLLDLGVIPSAYIDVENAPSAALFRKLSFTRRHTISFILYEP